MRRSNLVLAAWAVCVAAILFLSDRPWSAFSLARIDPVAELPDTPAFADVRRYTEIGSGFLPYFPGEARPETVDRPALKLGWAYREIGLMRMPFWVSSDIGYVAYYEQPTGRQIGILSPSQVEMIEQRTGRRFTREYAFPWYLKPWGWLVVLGLVGWTLFSRREARLIEDAHWAA